MNAMQRYHQHVIRIWVKSCEAEDEAKRVFRNMMFYARIEPWGA